MIMHLYPDNNERENKMTINNGWHPGNTSAAS